MLRNTILAALAIIAFGGFASAGILDAYDPYENTTHGALELRSVDRMTTSAIEGGNGFGCGGSR